VSPSYDWSTDTSKAEPGRAKKPYSAPELVRYGTVAELTKGANLAVGDGFAGDVGDGSVNPPGLGR
jgi:hypothetical protein